MCEELTKLGKMSETTLLFGYFSEAFHLYQKRICIKGILINQKFLLLFLLMTFFNISSIWYLNLSLSHLFQQSLQELTLIKCKQQTQGGRCSASDFVKPGTAPSIIRKFGMNISFIKEEYYSRMSMVSNSIYFTLQSPLLNY